MKTSVHELIDQLRAVIIASEVSDSSIDLNPRLTAERDGSAGIYFCGRSSGSSAPFMSANLDRRQMIQLRNWINRILDAELVEQGHDD